MKEMTVGERIQQLREAAGLSQEQLAEQIDVSRQSVSKWELNDAAPEISKIIALSELFGISTDELLKGAESAHAAPKRQESIDTIARLNAAEKRIRTGFITAVNGLSLKSRPISLCRILSRQEAFYPFRRTKRCLRFIPLKTASLRTAFSQMTD